MSQALVVPTSSELEALSPGDRWDLEDALDNAQGVLREFNDEELQRWVEVEGKTQAEIAEAVGRSQQRISQRCTALGIEPRSPRGRPPRITSPSNSEEAEVLDGEVVPDEKPRRSRPDPPEGAAHFLPDVVAEDALDNLRTQALHWFEQGLLVKGLLDKKRPIEPRSEDDRKAIKREAAVMARVARRIEEAVNAA